MPRRLLLAFALCLLLVGVHSAAQTSLAADPRFAPAEERIKKALVDTNIPSISVAVAQKGQIIWEQGFGWADRENRVPANEHTMYSVASVSKPIAATGLMVLVERGVIDLDKPIDNYLGEAKLRARVGNAAEATVRRVANHTSGLPLHYQFFYADESVHPPTRDETIRRYGNLVTAPGEHYQYSNIGYGILDYVVERGAGKPFGDFMREEVFLPLGLTHTSIDIAPGLESHQAIRYTPEGARIPFYEFDHPGASAVYASAHDLARFGMFQLKEHLPDQRAILTDASLDAMHTPTANSGDGSGYGIGWGSFVNGRGYRCVQHTGGMPGVATVCRFVPSERLVVVVLANSRAPLAYRLVDTITDAILPQREKPEEGPPKQDSPGPNPGAFKPSAELLGTWRGTLSTYKSEKPLTFTILESGDVHVRLDRQLLTLLDGASFSDGFLRGRFMGDVDYDDARGRKYQLQVELKLRDGVLNGPITTATIPDRWGSSAVTHWAELKRLPPEEPK